MTDFIRIPSNPVPPGGELKCIETADGAHLRAAFFPVEGARACAVLMSGRSEFIEKYFEVINDLHARKIAVATMDWRGQGLSSRLLPVSEKGHINDYGTYQSDLRNFIEQDVKPRFDGPFILMTHSMGGLPALHLLAEGYDFFERAILCAPLTDLELTPVMKAASKGMSKLATRVGFSRAAVSAVKEYSLEFDGNALTTDRERHKRFHDLQAAAPNACIYAPTYGWLNATMDGIQKIHEPGALTDIKTPVLIISAEKDDLVSTPDHVDLAKSYRQIDQLTITGALHEIMMERDELRDQYWKAVDDFIAPSLPATA